MIEYLVRNEDYLVAVKPPSLCSEETADGRGFCDLLRAENGGFLAPVYRLDRGVGGAILYARSAEAAAFFAELVRAHALQKEYVAVLCGVPSETAGELRDLLFYDRQKNRSYVVSRARRGVKEAILQYRVLQAWNAPDGQARCAVLVHLLTGRTHQIRAQFSSRGLPLLGDRRYGGAPDQQSRDISLWCRSVSLPAYRARPAVTVTSEPPFLAASDPYDYTTDRAKMQGR